MNSHVRRRDVVASIGAGALAGCLGGSPDALSVALEATVVLSITAYHPARLRLTFTNETDEPIRLSPGTMRGIDGPLTAIRGRHRDDGRQLLAFYRGRDLDRYVMCAESAATPIPAARVEGCWQTRCSEGLEIIFAHGPTVLEAGDALVGEYTLLDGFDDGCLDPGTYDFEDSTAIGRATGSDDTAEFAAGSKTLVRRLAVTLDDAGTVSATAEAVVRTDAPDQTGQ